MRYGTSLRARPYSRPERSQDAHRVAGDLATVGVGGTIGGGRGTAGREKEACGASSQPEGARHVDLSVEVVTEGLLS